MSDVGNPPHSIARTRPRHPHRSAAVSRLARRRGGGGADRYQGALARRSRGLRARLLVFIRRGVDGGRPADPPHRAQRARADVPHQHRLCTVRTVRRSDGGVDAAVQAGGRDPRGADHLALSRACMARRSISAIPIRSGLRISQSLTTAIQCRWKPTRSRVLGVRRDTASGDRGGEAAVCHHPCARIDAGDGSAEQAARGVLADGRPESEDYSCPCSGNSSPNVFDKSAIWLASNNAGSAHAAADKALRSLPVPPMANTAASSVSPATTGP